MTFDAIVDGFRYLRLQHSCCRSSSSTRSRWCFGMPSSLFPALAQHVFRDPASVGYLFAAPAVGAFLISLFSGWAMRVRRQGLRDRRARCAAGARRSPPSGSRTRCGSRSCCSRVAGAADQVSAIFRSTIVLTVTPDHMRGRLGGIEFAQVASTPSLGNLEAGVVAQLTSLRFSIVSGGIGCIARHGSPSPRSSRVLLRYDARER